MLVFGGRALWLRSADEEDDGAVVGILEAEEGMWG